MRFRLSLALVSSQWLAGLGLKTFLSENFPKFKVTIFSDKISYNEALKYISFDVVLTLGDIHISDAYNIDLTNSQGAVVAFLEEILHSESFDDPEGRAPSLTVREIDVLRLLTQGLFNKEIADQLDISLHTVISHRKNITGKLGIKTVSGLTIYALMHDLMDDKSLFSNK